MPSLTPLTKLLSSFPPPPSILNPLAFLPGLLALTPLTSIPIRTALRGPSPLDPLVLAPGLHLQPTAASLHKGEYPACAALTTGYVFRIENPATIFFLQRISRTGHLTNLRIAPTSTSTSASTTSWPHRAAALTTVLATAHLYALADPWALFFVGNLFAIRLFNFLTLRRRSQPGWFGASEPGVEGDLFVALSQDRWVRIRGPVDDLKALTSGTWLKQATMLERFFGGVAALLMYANVAVAGCATGQGVVIVAGMLLGNAGLLGLDSLRLRSLEMYGRVMEVVGEPVKYARRRDLAEQLIRESGRDDWAVGMGLIVKEGGKTATM